MIFLQAAANEESPAANALDLLDTGEIQLYLSAPILEELRDVLGRGEVRTALPQISDVRIEALFRRLDKKAVMVRNVPRSFEYSRDPTDEPYLNLAIAVKAKFLLSRDRDLLESSNLATFSRRLSAREKRSSRKAGFWSSFISAFVTANRWVVREFLG